MRIDFMICGAQKGGTTALATYLRHHPEICMANSKEIHFFDNDNYFAVSKPDYDYYHSHFTRKPFHKIAGEATPIYMYWDSAPKRMWAYNPDLKIIIVLRNPIDRAYSHWNMVKLQNIETLSFWEAITTEQDRCRSALPNQHRKFSYIDRGFYLSQLRRLWHYFSKEQVLILRNEELKQHPDRTMVKVCAFLGVALIHVAPSNNINKLRYDAPMSKRERDHLRSVFEFEIRGLERVLGWDCSDWLS